MLDEQCQLRVAADRDNIWRHTCDGTFFRAVDGVRARISFDGIVDILAVRPDIKLQRSVLNGVRMIAVDPSALRNVLAAFFEATCRLNAVVPNLTTCVSDVPGPDSARRAVELADSDPGNTSRIIIVGHTDVAGTPGSYRLVDHLGAQSAGVDLAPLRLPSVSVAIIIHVNFANRATL